MARVTWTGELDQLVYALKTAEQRLIPVGVSIVRETVEEGAKRQEKALNEATTPTGEERYGRGQGGSAGRNDTGDMIDRIETDVQIEGNTIIGTWGWDAPDDKIIAQEFGIGNPPAAHSLETSFYPTRESFKGRVAKATSK